MKVIIEPIINGIICKVIPLLSKLCWLNDWLIEGANLISRPKQVKHFLKAQVTCFIAVYINFVTVLNNRNSFVLLTMAHCMAPHNSGWPLVILPCTIISWLGSWENVISMNSIDSELKKVTFSWTFTSCTVLLFCKTTIQAKMWNEMTCYTLYVTCLNCNYFWNTIK